jgi:acetyltransferase-like isoleucine patch superfamily enzyme
MNSQKNDHHERHTATGGTSNSLAGQSPDDVFAAGNPCKVIRAVNQSAGNEK